MTNKKQPDQRKARAEPSNGKISDPGQKSSKSPGTHKVP